MWKCADSELKRQIRCFPYEEPPLVMDLLNMQQASYSLSSYQSEECCKIIHAVKTHFYKFNTQGKLLAVNTSPVCY
jgi:hypothetical protein